MLGDLKSVLEESSNWHQASIAEFHFREYRKYSEKYNLQKFEDSRSFVVIYSEYSQLTLAIIFADDWQPCCVCSATPGKMPKIAGKFVISVHVFLRFFNRDGGHSTISPLWLRACVVCAMEFS